MKVGNNLEQASVSELCSKSTPSLLWLQKSTVDCQWAAERIILIEGSYYLPLVPTVIDQSTSTGIMWVRLNADEIISWCIFSELLSLLQASLLV